MRVGVMWLEGGGRHLQLAPSALFCLCSMFVVPLLFVSLATPALSNNSQPPPKEAPKATPIPSSEISKDSCFCAIDSGILEDCPCTTENIKSFNKLMHQKVVDLVGENYFRFFQVNFNKPCKFWDDRDGQCASRNCAVDTCPAHTVPDHIVNNNEQIGDKPHADHTAASYLQEKFHEFLPLVEPLVVYIKGFARDYFPGVVVDSCLEDPLPLYSRVDTALPPDSDRFINEFCTLDPLEADESCDYIDLLKNEEKFTGYTGPSPNRIWSKIYSDLCFKQDGKCLEERTFYRIVSGLHTSITIHLCRNYLLQDENVMMGRKAVWGPNVQEFLNRFDPKLTSGEGPEWLKNVYYLYLVELRAISKAGDLLTSLGYGDEATAARVKDVVATARQFPTSFDEKELFKDHSAAELLVEFKNKFREISHMMDCMGCERCKVWGKLQVTGIGTALKILFTPPGALRLTRHEVVALLNAFGRVSTSINEIDSFRKTSK